MKPDIGDVPFETSLVNGQIEEVFTVDPGMRLRFRVANLGSTYQMRMRFQGHKMEVVATGGVPRTPKVVDSCLIDLGERVDVIVTMDQPVGNYWFYADTLEDKPFSGTRATLRYAGAPLTRPPEARPEWGEILRYDRLTTFGGVPLTAPDVVGVHTLGPSNGICPGIPQSWFGDSPCSRHPPRPASEAPQ